MQTNTHTVLITQQSSQQPQQTIAHLPTNNNQTYTILSPAGSSNSAQIVQTSQTPQPIHSPPSTANGQQQFFDDASGKSLFLA